MMMHFELMCEPQRTPEMIYYGHKNHSKDQRSPSTTCVDPSTHQMKDQALKGNEQKVKRLLEPQKMKSQWSRMQAPRAVSYLYRTMFHSEDI